MKLSPFLYLETKLKIGEENKRHMKNTFAFALAAG